MKWQHERRLVFVAGPEWNGWFCERCCWNQRLPDRERERDALARGVKVMFDSHDCEEFALANWEKAALVECN